METHQMGDVTVARLGPVYSALDEATMDEAERSLRGLLDDPGPPRVVLDFTQTRFFSSTFLELLLELWGDLKARRGSLALCGLSENCGRVLSASGLDSLWSVHADAAHAADAVRSACAV